MGILLIFLGCFLLYTKSKYVPKYFSNLEKWAKARPIGTRLIAYGLFITSIIVLCLQNGLATGLVIFLIALIFGLCITIILIPLNKKYAYWMAGLSVLFIIIENTF